MYTPVKFQGTVKKTGKKQGTDWSFLLIIAESAEFSKTEAFQKLLAEVKQSAQAALQTAT